MEMESTIGPMEKCIMASGKQVRRMGTENGVQWRTRLIMAIGRKERQVGRENILGKMVINMMVIGFIDLSMAKAKISLQTGTLIVASIGMGSHGVLVSINGRMSVLIKGSSRMASSMVRASGLKGKRQIYEPSKEIM